MAKCAKCAKFLSPIGAATCTNCLCMFHKACVAIPHTRTVLKCWLCSKCKKKIRQINRFSVEVKYENQSHYGRALALTPSEAPQTASDAYIIRDNLIEEIKTEFQTIRRDMAMFISCMKGLKMEAVVFNGKTLEVSYDPNYPMPKIENDTDVLIRVEYAGICGTDLHIIQDNFPATKARPIAMGHELCGVVHDVGPKSIFKKGQKVVVDPNSACNLCIYCRKGKYQYCQTAGNNDTVGIWKDGGWAQYCLVPQMQVFALPDEITTEQGGLCEPYSCVAHGFDRASPLLVGEKILIVGAGIIGNLWATTLHHHGHREVTISEMNKTRLDIVKKLDLGFRLVSPDVLAKEQPLFDAIIDCTGVGKVMEINFKYLSQGGKYVLFGCCPATHTATIHPFDIYNKEVTVIGIKINPYSVPNAIGWLKAMGSRYLDYDRLGVKTYELKDYKNALNDLRTGVVAKAMFKITA